MINANVHPYERLAGIVRHEIGAEIRFDDGGTIVVAFDDYRFFVHGLGWRLYSDMVWFWARSIIEASHAYRDLTPYQRSKQ